MLTELVNGALERDRNSVTRHVLSNLLKLFGIRQRLQIAVISQNLIEK